MKHTKSRVILLLLCVAFVLTGVRLAATAAQKEDNSPPKYKIEYTTEKSKSFEKGLKIALEKSLDQWNKKKPGNNKFYLVGQTSAYKDWGIVSMTSSNIEIGEGVSIDTAFSIIYLKSKTTNKWLASTDTGSDLKAILDQVPLSEFDTSSRNAFFPSTTSAMRVNALATTTPNYKLPWRTSQTWRLTQGWHEPDRGNPALDLIPIGLSNADILASESGKVTWYCEGTSKQSDFYVTTSNTTQKFRYTHINLQTLTVGLNSTVTQGQYLGQMVEGNVTEKAKCGNWNIVSQGTHLHIEVPYKPFTMDGYTFPLSIGATDPDPNGIPPKNVYMNTNLKYSQNTTTACVAPTSGDWVITSSNSISNSCPISGYQLFNENIIVKSPVELVINSSGILDMNLASKYLKVENGAKVTVKNGGKIN